MTPVEINTLLNIRCKTTDTTFTLADKLVLVNLMKDEISGIISDRKEEAFVVEVKDDLEADVREYPYQTDVMNQLVRIELMFADGGEYVLATPTKLNMNDIPMQEDNITGRFDNDYPQYFIKGKHIVILSGTIIAITDGLKWLYKVFPGDLANLTGVTDISIDASATSLGFPREFHELLVRRVSIEYKDTNKIKLTSRELKYEKDLEDAVDRFDKPVSSEEIFGGMPDDRSDNGFNY